MLMVVILALVLLACGLLALSPRNSSKDEPPVLPGGLILIGHAHILFGKKLRAWELFKKMSHASLKAGGVISTFVGPQTLYWVTDPNDFWKVANTCLDKSKLYDFVKPYVGNGIGTSSSSVWKVHRKLINAAFSQVVLDGFQDIFNAQSRRLVQELEVEIGKGPFDHSHCIQHNALETLCLTLGVDFTNNRHVLSEYINAIEDIMDVFMKRFQRVWLHSDFIYNWTELKRKQDEYLKIMHNMPDTIVSQRKAYYLNNRKCKKIEEKAKGPIFKSVMDLLLELSIEKGFLSEYEIKEHMYSIIFAGYDTLAGVLMFTMLLVASYANVQDEIWKELHVVFGDDDRDVTKQDLSQLVYLEAVLKESMRIYPIAPYVIRHLDTDIKLRNCTLSKGRTCLLSIYGVHRHPMWGPDADEFKPERWLDPATFRESTIIPFAAFSMGRRNCLGQPFAYMSMKTTLAHIFRHYRLTGDHKKMTLKMNIMLKPVSGHYIAIEKRTK
ncbi:cytochrome P450 4C1-like [Maniola jurtina]|uniref:cytochrome P450 4C1-like n=1 Tax=Maniola jurtina TaxID=191418 RepID=UPI001E68D125|nr:cytochrome P450 4C1-like [Maniola jurtina]